MYEMKKKDRLKAAVRFETVDRLPNTYRASDHISKEIVKFFGLQESSALKDQYKEILDYVHADFWSSGSKIGKFSTFFPTYKGEVPKTPYIDDGQLFYTLGIRSTVGTIAQYNIQYVNFGVESPFADVERASDLKEGFLMPKVDLFDFASMQNRYVGESLSCDYLKRSENDLICMGALNNIYMICCYLRGMDNFLMDLVCNKGVAEKIIYEVSDFCLEYNLRELESFGQKADYYGGWDDVAGQNGMMFAPSIFEKYFLPFYKQLIENVKKYNLIFGWHCCGSIHDVLPFMIDAGIDIFDVVQTSAKDMELENLYRLYGKKICFHGAIDIQKVLVSGNPVSIKEEVKKIKGLWGLRGGMILAPSHEIVPGTPLENIIAIYNEG